MCVSIVVAVKIGGIQAAQFTERVAELGRVYGYGIGMGSQNLLPEARESIISVLNEPEVIFEIHDLTELHCACDIDLDIRNMSKLDKPSKFFDFIKEIIEYRDVSTLSVLFFQEQLPESGNIRRQLGTYLEFVNLLNRWNTWQVEGFEPIRKAYFIADESPLIFTFTDKQLLTGKR